MPPMPEPLAPSSEIESDAASTETDERADAATADAETSDAPAPPPPERRKRDLPEWAWTAVCAVVGAATGLWLTRHAWGPHLLAGGDITADLIRANFGIAHL